MTPADYERHVVGELCWDCHAATHGSSARQRQCPRCRAKWSYRRRQAEWGLLRAFELYAPCGLAARVVGCSPQTAARAYAVFRGTLRKEVEAGRSHARRRLRERFGRYGWALITPETSQNAAPYAAIVAVAVGRQVHAVVASGTAVAGLAAGLRGVRPAAAAFAFRAGRSPASAPCAASSGPPGGAALLRVAGYWAAARATVLRHCRGVGTAGLDLLTAECDFRLNGGGGAVRATLFSRLIEPRITVHKLP